MTGSSEYEANSMLLKNYALVLPFFFPEKEIRHTQWRTQGFFSVGVQQIQLRTEDREDGDLGAVAP